MLRIGVGHNKSHLKHVSKHMWVTRDSRSPLAPKNPIRSSRYELFNLMNVCYNCGLNDVCSLPLSTVDLLHYTLTSLDSRESVIENLSIGCHLTPIRWRRIGRGRERVGQRGGRVRRAEWEEEGECPLLLEPGDTLSVYSCWSKTWNLRANKFLSLLPRVWVGIMSLVAKKLWIMQQCEIIFPHSLR